MNRLLTRLPLRWSIPLMVVILAVLAGGPMTFYVMNTASREVEHEAGGEVRSTLALLQSGLNAFFRASNPVAVHNTVAQLAIDPDVSTAVLVDQDGIVWASAGHRQRGRPIVGEDPAYDPVIAEKVRLSGISRLLFSPDREFIYGYAQIISDYEPVTARPSQTSVMFIRYSLVHSKAQARYGALSSLWLILSGVMLSSVVLWGVLYRLVTRRIRHLIEAATAIGAGDLAVRSHFGGNDEIAHLALAMDQMTRDIAAGHRRLSESESRFRTLFDNVGDAVFVFPLDEAGRPGPFIEVNRFACQRLGYSREQLLRLGLSDLSGVEREPDIPHIMRELRRQGSRVFEWVYVTRDGERIPVEINAHLFTHQDTTLILTIARNLTGRKQLEMELLQFRSTLDLTLDAVLMCAPGDLGIFYANRGAAELLGLQVEALLGTALPELLAEPERHRFAERVAPLPASGGGALNLESEIMRRGGTRVPVDLSIQYVVPPGESGRFVAILRDVTERRADRMALEVSERRYREFIEGTDDLVIQVDRLGHILFVNHAAQRIFGLSPQSCIGQSVLDFIHPDDRAESEAQFARWAAERQAHARFENRQVSRSGEVFHLLWSITADFDADGGVQSFNGIASDITERKRMEAALRESGHRLQEAQRIARLGHWTWELEAGRLEWSDEVYRIFGLQAEEFQPTYGGFINRVHPDDRQRVTESVEAALKGDAPYDIAFRVVRSDDVVATLHAQAEVERDAQGRPLLMVGTLQDISRITEAETELRSVNRALHTLSRCNVTLVHAEEEMQLLRDICRNLVDEGGYRFVWVGYAQHDAARSIRPMAHAGVGEALLSSLPLIWSDGADGRCPAGMAIRHGTVQITQDLETDTVFEHCRETALHFGFRSAIALPLRVSGEAIGAIVLYAPVPNAFHKEERALLEELSGDLSFGITGLRTRVERERLERRQLEDAEKLRSTLEETINAVALALEKRDPYTAGHQQRVAELAAAIAAELGMTEEQVEGIRLGGMIHDLGKINLPAEILTKPARLSDIEYALVKDHPRIGYEIVREVDFPWPVAEMVLQHHERLDGSGYPHGLTGDAIIPEARILAVADVVEAISSDRPYRPGMGVEAAMQEIRSQRGKGLDAGAVDACIALFHERMWQWGEEAVGASYRPVPTGRSKREPSPAP